MISDSVVLGSLYFVQEMKGIELVLNLVFCCKNNSLLFKKGEN